MNGNQLYFSSVYPMDSIVTIRNLARGWIGTKYRLNIIQETQSCRYIRKRTTTRGSEYSPKLLVINPQKIITNLNNYKKEFTMWAQPEPPFHFLIMDEILRGLCLNRVKPLKSPHPELLHESILFGGFFECKHSFTDKPMVITEPAVPSSQLLGY